MLSWEVEGGVALGPGPLVPVFGVSCSYINVYILLSVSLFGSSQPA